MNGAYKFLDTCFSTQANGSKLFPMLSGPPGIGKSQVVRQWAENNGYEMKVIILSRYGNVDVVGGFVPDMENKVLVHMPTERLFKNVNGKRTLFFFDEITDADPGTITAFQSFTLDGEIEGVTVDPESLFAFAGNRPEHGTGSKKPSTAFMDRVAYYEVEFNKDAWCEYMTGRVDPRIIAYVEFDNEAFPTFDGRAKGWKQTTPRGYERLSEMLTSNFIPDEKLVCSVIGAKEASRFVSFCQLQGDLISYHEIIDLKGEYQTPNSISLQWAMIGNIVYNLGEVTEPDEEEMGYIFKFMSEFPEEIQSVFCRMVEKYAKPVTDTETYSTYHASKQNS